MWQYGPESPARGSNQSTHQSLTKLSFGSVQKLGMLLPVVMTHDKVLLPLNSLQLKLPEANSYGLRSLAGRSTSTVPSKASHTTLCKNWECLCLL